MVGGTGFEMHLGGHLVGEFGQKTSHNDSTLSVLGTFPPKLPLYINYLIICPLPPPDSEKIKEKTDQTPKGLPHLVVLLVKGKVER